MYAVGIDVSSHHSTAAVLSSPTTVVFKPFEVPHTPEGIKQLAERLIPESAGSRGYYWSRSLSTFSSIDARLLYLNSYSIGVTDSRYLGTRAGGECVRPVRVQN